MKNTIKLCMISLMVVAGIVTLSCTDGTFEGTGDGGNLNIVGFPSEHEGKYCEASTSTLSFGSSSPRIQIKSGAVKAPLYTNGGEKYNGSETLTVTVTLYEAASGGTPIDSKTKNGVKFYSGSGLVNW